MRHAGPARTARVLTVSAVGAAALVGTAALTTAVLAVVFARRVIVPPKSRPEDLRILGSTEDTVTLSRTMDSLTPGRYSLWFAGDTGHARVGEIRAVDDDKVVRQLLGVEFGDLGAARRGRFSGWFYLSPADLGVPYQDVEIGTEVGAAPAWLIPAEAGTPDDWGIMVHGRAVTRSECLRAVPTFREQGYTSLVVSYRNDGDAPNSGDRRYALGDREWRDVASAIDYALDHGAQRIVLMGWSMGGSTVLQTVTRSPHPQVRGIVLESPVVDWVTALHFQGVVNRLPPPVQWATLQVLTNRWARLLTGQSETIDLHRLDIVRRANELDVPILLLHSTDDGFIPATASRALAEVRPDIVTYEEFTVARHARLWNYDEPRWTRAIANWLRVLR